MDSLVPGKGPGKNGIPAEIPKCYKSRIHPPPTAQDSLPVLKGRQSATRHNGCQYSVSLFIKTRVIGAIATTIMASPSSVLSETSLLE